MDSKTSSLKRKLIDLFLLYSTIKCMVDKIYLFLSVYNIWLIKFLENEQAKCLNFILELIDLHNYFDNGKIMRSDNKKSLPFQQTEKNIFWCHVYYFSIASLMKNLRYRNLSPQIHSTKLEWINNGIESLFWSFANLWANKFKYTQLISRLVY